MPRFGSHLSVAGGCHKAVEAAQRYGCEALQIFTKNSNQWNARDLTAEEVRTFRRAVRQSGLRVVMAHDSYLINLASPDEGLHRRSVEAFLVELRRAEQLGLRYVITHPGAPLDSGEEAGVARVAAALDEVHRRLPRLRVRVLLENTAGQGSALGHRFEQLAAILAGVAEPRRVGVCFDTCHAFAAGYGLAPEAEYHATMRALARAVGLGRVKAFHLNDSLKPQGSRVDRHAHIGRGHLGLEPFRLLVNDPRFRHRPMVLETAKEEGDNKDMDAVNLKTLRALVAPERRRSR